MLPPPAGAMSLDTKQILQALSKRFEALEAKLEMRFASSGPTHHGQEAASEYLPMISSSVSATSMVVTPPTAAASTFSGTITVNTDSEHAAVPYTCTKDAATGYTPTRCSTLVPTPMLVPVNNAAATPPSFTPTKPLGEPAAPSAEDVANNNSSTCPFECIQVWYISNSTLSYSNGVVVLPCLSTGVPDVKLVLEGLIAQKSLMLVPMFEHRLSKAPWPPPIHLDMQRTDVQLRPIPWPSFGYWNVHCASCQHNKNDRNSALWIVWKILWLFSVLVCWNSESLAAVIVITRAHMLFQYLSTLHRPISIPCDDGIFRWPQTQIIGDFVPAHRGSNLQTGYYCLSNILSRFYTWRFELVQYETLMPSQMNVQFKTLGPPPDWTWSSGCEDNDAFIQTTGVGLWPIIIQMFQLMCITFGTITTATRHLLTSLSLVISMDRCMMQSLSCEFSLKVYSKWFELHINAMPVVGFGRGLIYILFQSHHDTNTTNGGYAAGSKEVLAWEISIAPHYNSNMRISIAINCSVLLDYGKLIRQHHDGEGSFSLYPFLLVNFSHKHWQCLLAASFEEIKLQYVRSCLVAPEIQNYFT